MPTAAEIRAELERRKKAAPPPAAPTGNRPDPEAIKAELARRGVASQPSFFQRQGQRMVAMGTPQPAAPSAPDPNAPNPITMAMRQSTAQVNAQFPARKAAEERYAAELAAMNAASPIPFKNTGPGGPLELNQERPDLLGTRAVARGINTNIGAANAAIDTGARMGVALGAAGDPSVQGALAGMEYYRGDSDAPERLASAVQRGGYAQQMQQLDQQGDAIPSLPIPQAQTAGEVGADIVGQIGGYVLGPGRFISKPGQNIGAVAGAGRIRGAVTREGIENLGHAYAFGASAAEPGSDRNMAGLETAMNPLSYVSIEAVRAAPRAFKALDNALTGPARLTPTNAGGARPAPAPQPSVAPVAQPAVSNAPQRPAQPGPTGAGQQPAGAAQPVLNAVPTAPAISKAQAREAKDTAIILGRIMRAGGIKNNAIRGYLPGLIQRYESLGNSRIPLARFIERDLPQHFPEGVAGDVVAKLRGFGRERDASTGPNDTSRYTVQETKKQLRTTQQDHLTDVIRSNTYKKDLIDAEDKIRADMRLNAEAGYETALANGIDRFAKGKVTADEAAAWDGLEKLMKAEPFLSRVPEHVKVQAMRSGKTLEQMIEEDPFRTAHWLQSALGKSERAAQGPGGKSTPESLLYNELRQAVLEPLEKSVPGYKGARKAHGDLFGADEAMEFGEDLFLAARSEVETARKARDFNKLSKAQQTVATMSIRDKLLNEFRGTPEDAAAKLTRLQQEGVLDAIERILGADGKRITAAIRETVEENDWLRSIDQGSGSNTFGNAAGARDAAENVRGPVNKAVGSLGDKRTYLGAVVGDVVLSSVGVPPVLTVGKATSDVVGAAGRPSARQLSNATKGLFGLPQPAPTNALLPNPKPPRGPRKTKAPEQVEADLEALLKRYDEIDHRNNPTESARVLKQIDALKKRLAKTPAPTGPRRPPEQAGFASPGVLLPLAGGAGGYIANPVDANRDGVIDDADRPLNAMGGLVTGVAGSAAANKLLGPRRGAAPAGRFRGPSQMTFGGVNAKTADKAALARAQNMEAEGASRDAIWDETGWFKGVDGKWRFEIDDSGAKLTGNKSGPLGSVLDHPELYKAYPDMASTRVVPQREPGASNIAAGKFNDEIIGVGPTQGSDLRSNILHEAGGHGAQNREGFATGGTPTLGNKREDVQRLAQKAYEDSLQMSDEQLLWELSGEVGPRPPNKVGKPWAELPLREQLKWHEAGRERAYRSLAGEVEARNVEARRDFTPEQRRAKRPWETQDVPDDQQIVRFGSGKAESRPKPPTQAGFGGAPVKGGSGTVQRMIAGGVVGGMAGTFAGQADAQTPETTAELDRARKEREDVLAILADLQEQQKFFATATEEELQKRLDREGFDLGPTGADGTIGPVTRAAIKGRKAEIEKEAEAALKRLASANENLEKWERQAAFEKTRPTEEQQAFRDYAPLFGGIAGALGAKGARLGGSGISHLTANSHIKKSNALLNATPISPPRSVADRAAIRERATNLNEFWQRGGSKTNVPFAVKRDGTMEARPPKNVTPPAGLFPDKFIGRNVGAADVLIGGTGAIEAGLAYQNSEIIKEKLNAAIEIAKDDPTEANLARVQELEDQYAQAKAWMMLGVGVAGGTGIGVFTSKYASKRADIPKAEQELAILREYFAKQNKKRPTPSQPPPPPTPPAPSNPPANVLAATPPLPPSRPRRKP